MFKFSFPTRLVGLVFFFHTSIFVCAGLCFDSENLVPQVDTTILLCPGETYQYNNIQYTAPNLITDTLPGGNVLTLHLEVAPHPTTTTSFQLCPGDVKLVNGLFYPAPGTFYDTIPKPGCDLVATYIFELLPQPTVEDTFLFCSGASVNIRGKDYDYPTTLHLTWPSTTGGCDTAGTFYLDWLPLPTKTDAMPICFGDTIALGGQIYTTPGTAYFNLPSTNGGCDTAATIQIFGLPIPKKTETIQFCEGETVQLGGQTYSNSGTVKIKIESTTGGCDTLATFILEKLANPTFSKTIQFCPGETINIYGQNYSQSGTFNFIIASTTGGCDTLATFILEKLANPTFSKTIQFCPGETVNIYGQNYAQSGTFNFIIASTTGGCDTLATYFLENKTDGQTSAVSINCPLNITQILPAGTDSATINYILPTANSNCTCPGLDLSKTSGGAIGSTFSVGKNTVCWKAEDACGTTKTCCFTVNIEEKSPCDVKTMACLKWELLSINRDSKNNLVYRIRTTNRCASKLTHTYFGIPQGMTAVAPANNSIFEAASGRKYEVRNPNFSPAYSIRFKGKNPDLLDNGESDVLRFVLPPKVNPNFIYVAGRLENQLFEEWHLNTFDCPIGIEPQNKILRYLDIEILHDEISKYQNISISPNPASSGSVLSVDGREILEADFLLFDISGRVVFQGKVFENQVVLKNQELSTGVFFYKILENGQPAASGKLVVLD